MFSDQCPLPEMVFRCPTLFHDIPQQLITNHIAASLYVQYICLPLYVDLNLERQIYPLIARETGLPITSLSQSISRATSDRWEYDSRKA